MASRALKPAAKEFSIGLTNIRGLLTVGATGAVTAFRGYGITSITRNSAGKYTLLLDDVWKKLVSWNFGILQDARADATMQVTSEDVDNPTDASRSIVIQAWDVDADAAVELQSGAILSMTFTLQNSNLNMGPDLA